MKSLCSILLCLLAWNFGHAQCNISGSSTLAVNATGTYSIPSNLAQCSSCHDWDIIGGSGTIIGSDQGRSVTIRKTSSSNLTIRVTYFSESGCRSCTRVISSTPACNFTTTISNSYLDNFFDVFLTTENSPSTGPGATYNWTVNYNTGPSYFATTSTNVVNVPLPTNRSIVSASVTVNFQGCTFSDFHTYFPPITSQFGFGAKADTESTFDTQNIEAYPNPTTGELNFTGLSAEGYTVTVLDLTGKEIIRDAPSDRPLNISEQPSGVYQYLIRNGKDIVKSGKLLKE
ncbi:MAG: T9SS type A sorting domain-containing protein [Bacteroidota bacterium]